MNETDKIIKLFKKFRKLNIYKQLEVLKEISNNDLTFKKEYESIGLVFLTIMGKQHLGLKNVLNLKL